MKGLGRGGNTCIKDSCSPSVDCHLLTNLPRGNLAETGKRTKNEKPRCYCATSGVRLEFLVTALAQLTSWCFSSNESRITPEWRSSTYSLPPFRKLFYPPSGNSSTPNTRTLRCNKGVLIVPSANRTIIRGSGWSRLLSSRKRVYFSRQERAHKRSKRDSDGNVTSNLLLVRKPGEEFQKRYCAQCF